MAYDVAADIRLDPRIKAILASFPVEPAGDVDSRETLLAEANSDTARQQAELFRSYMELCDTEDAAPSAGNGATSGTDEGKTELRKSTITTATPLAAMILPQPRKLPS